MDLARAQAMVATMAEMQEHHNRNVHPRWREQNYAYYRAVWVECAELLDHFGWKWWKLQRPELDQVKLEVVDIWHFGLSDLMRADALDISVAERLLGAVPRGDAEPSWDDEAFRLAVEDLAAATLDRRSFGRIGAEGKHYLRISIATALSDLEEAVHRIAAAAADRDGFQDFLRQERYGY